MRVFISSTFKDLNPERNYIMKMIFPRLKEVARELGIDLVILDLRWGITSEDTKNGKVLEICLREIDNSHPYFIGIIGNRYGWCPSETDYNNNKNLYYSYHKIKKYIRRQLSITEIEFKYAALDCHKRVKALFFLKECKNTKNVNNAEEQKKLERFKDKVIHNKRYPVNKFKSKKQLGKLIYNYILEELNNLSPKRRNINKYQELKESQQWYISSLIENYVPNVNSLKAIDEIINKKISTDSKGGISIQGPSGSGRSSLLAYWIMHNKTKDFNLIYFFMTPGTEKQDTAYIATYIINQIKEIYKIEEDDYIHIGEAHIKATEIIKEIQLEYPKEWLDIFYNVIMLGRYIRGKKPLIIAIDGIFNLPAEEYALMLGIQTFTKDDFYYILTDDHKIFEYDTVTVKPLTTKQCKQIITIHLSKYGKRLNPHQLNKICQGAFAQNAKLLKILLDELVIYDSHEKLDGFIDYYLTANNKKAFYHILYDRYESDYGKELITDIISIFKLIEGECLSEDEIVEITKTSFYKWSCFFSAAKNQFEVINGLIRMPFYAKDDIILERYITDKETEYKYRKRIVDYIKSKDYLHVDRYCRIMAIQLYKAEDYETFLQYMSLLPIYKSLIRTDRNRLRMYWDHLSSNNDNYITNCPMHVLYQQMLNEDAPADDFHCLAYFIRECDYVDKKTMIKCLYEAEKRYMDLPDKKSSRYNALYEISYYVPDKEALDALQKALNVFPDDPNYNYARIDCYAEISFIHERLLSLDKAIYYLEKALALKPDKFLDKIKYNHTTDRLLIKLSEFHYAKEHYNDSLKYSNLALKHITSYHKEDVYTQREYVDIYIRMGMSAWFLNMNSDCKIFINKVLSIINLDKEFDYSDHFKMCINILENYK